MNIPEAPCGDTSAIVLPEGEQNLVCASAKQGILFECATCVVGPTLSTESFRTTVYPMLEIPEQPQQMRSDDDHPSSAREY